jgi:hypothetical protein
MKKKKYEKPKIEDTEFGGWVFSDIAKGEKW